MAEPGPTCSLRTGRPLICPRRAEVDPKRLFDSMRALWQLPNWNCQGVDSGDDLLLPGSLLAHATGFVAQELLVIVQIAVEGLDATLGDEPELVTYRAQQGPVVTDQHHCAFEFVEC